MFILNSSEPIKVDHLQKLANQLMLSGVLVIEMVNNSFSESKKNFGSCDKRNVLIKKWRYGQIPLDFAKYLSYWELQKK